MMKRTDDVSSTMVQTEQDATGAALRCAAASLAPRPSPLALIRLALLLLLPALLWLAMPQGASALPRIWYVDKDATSGANDGTSWANAYTTLQAALDVANANQYTNYEIWVAEGTYYPDEGGSHIANSQEEYFVIINNNVQLYGGFGGDETERTQRDWRAHPTMLSGDIDQDGALTNNAYHVLYLDGVTGPNITAATVIDGFTVTGGNANGADPHNNGGGLLCYGHDSGRACSPTLANIAFIGNAAQSGGGGCFDGTNGQSSPTLTNVTFRGNQASDTGGGMSVFCMAGTCTPQLTNVLFTGNKSISGGGGGMYLYDADSATLTNVTFSGNSAADYKGGGLHFYRDSFETTAPLTITNSIFWGNSPQNLFSSFRVSVVAAYSDIDKDGYTGNNNIRQDPRFVAPIAASSAPTTTGDYRLQTGSPAIDAGSNLSVTVATDLDGNQRIVNGVVDMGAYEKLPEPALSLTKQVTPTTDVAYQGVVTYTLVLSNSGGAADGAAILTDTLPAGTTFARWIEQNGAAIDAGQLTWGSGAVDAGAAITVSFAVTNTAGGGATITNTAWFSGSLQTGSAAAAYATSTTLTPSGSGNWSAVYPPCTGICKYIVPSGFTVTLDQNITLQGDFEVEPGGTFVPNGKTVTLTGDRAQTLTGNPLIFYNLVVDKTNKSDTVTIDGKLKVTKKLTVRKGSLVSASTYEDLEIEANGVLTLTSPITITGHFTNAGELNTEGNTVRFAGGKEQNLVLEVMTWFDDLEVYTGTTLIETVTDDNALVQGTLTNNGVIRKTQSIASPLDPDPANNVYYFGLAGAYSYGLEIAITALDGVDPLTAIQVDRIDRPQPNGPASSGEPIYWTITGVGSDFVADVTLPHAGIATPLACRYSAGVWTCANTASGADYVSFDGATAFSDWAVYSCAPMVTVQNTNDSGAGTLRQAIADICTGGAIDFAAGLNGQTITLSSELTVTRGMTIRSTAPITVSGNNAVRVFNVSGGPVTLDGLTIRDGNAGSGYGGGIYNSGLLTLTNSSVLSSTANRGSGMYNDRTSPVVTSVTFSGNHALAGGTMYNNGYNGVSSPTLANVTFSGNQVEFGSGGAMYNAGAAGGVSSPSLTKVTFSGNQAGTDGGAMYNNGNTGGASSPSLVDVTFSGNQADAGGAMYNVNVSSPSLIDVTFTGNQATFGGAIVNYGSTSRTSMVNVTFSGNRAGDQGGAMYNALSSPSLINVILWGNSANGGGAQMANIAATPSIHHSLVPSTTADILDILGGAITWGDGNLTDGSIDPLFVAPIAAGSAPTTTGDYRLRACSPAIDAGDNLSVTVATDLDGNPRIVNGIVDMGAYEAALMPCLHLAKAVTPTTNVAYQGVVTYTLILSNSGVLTDTAALTDVLPAQVAFGGWVESHGADEDGSVITWSGAITPATALTYVFTATHTAAANSTVTNTAEFSGSLQSDQAAAAFTTVAAATTTAIASDPNPSSYGQSVVFTATVAAAGGPPTGDVVFEIDDMPVHTGTLTSGVATYATASLAVGDHPIYAEYVGSANFIASESAVITQTVLKATAAVTLTALSQTYDGTPKAATAATAPAGLTVNLTYDGSTTQPIAAGSYTVVGAVDDPSYTGVATDTLVIATAGTTTTLTSAPNPALAGASVTFTATVTVQPTGDGRSGGAGRWGGGGPTGNVTFQDGATDLGAVALANGVATFSTSTLAVGSHTITAVYAGDSNHAGNTSALLVQVIDRGVTAVNDAAGALEATPVTIAVLANDHDPASLGLTVITFTQGANGAVAIAAGGQSVIYTPTAAFTGTDSFTYGVEDGNGATDDALVTVVVAAQAVTDAPVQVAPADPAVSSTVAFSGTTAGVTLTLPAGFYTGTVTEKDIFYLAFTPVVTPTHSGPPSGWQFGGVNFTLEAFLNNASLSPTTFAVPVTITLAYSPTQVAGLKESTLTLQYWNGSAWVSDGITCTAPDTVNHTVTCQITHLTDFGLLGEGNPTAATLADFGAVATADAVTVLWTTADESNLAGFHLYRGAAADDPGVRLNGVLIPAQGAGGLGGFSYSYVDAVAMPPGAAWFYWLETVDFAGGATRHGPILAAALAPRLYLPAIMAGAGSAELVHTSGVTPVAQTAEEVQAEEISAPPPGDSPDETGGGAATVHLPLITR
jgi:uncharacterized repeat protein (TIGR01451 family)